MAQFNRRAFLGGSAASIGALLIPEWAHGLTVQKQSEIYVRHNVASPEGQAMLAIYAEAVSKMMQQKLYPQSDPLSWTFQWYTHAVYGSNMTEAQQHKAAEIKRLYPKETPHKKLAEAMWNTCQSHLGQREDFFLPWHRMYVFYFELLIRKVSGRNDFTLPYWDYTNPDHQTLPEQFRQPNDPTWGSLYREHRYEVVNKGDNITTSPGGASINLNALKSASYSGTLGDAGFCANLDQNPHGSVHVDVGNALGMGKVPWAANDPVFWLHHCNIDRLWASWNRAGGSNPQDSDFLGTQFIFAGGNGARVTAVVKDFLGMPGYEYDDYVPRPDGSVPFSQGLKASLSLAVSSKAISGPVQLSNASVTVNLGQSAPAMEKSSSLFSQQVGELANGSVLYLNLQGLNAKDFIAGVFDVYVHGPSHEALTRDSPYYVGQINFFGIEEMGHGMAHHKAYDKSVSFVLPAATRQALEASHIDQPQVTIVAAGEVTSNATPTVKQISLSAG